MPYILPAAKHPALRLPGTTGLGLRPSLACSERAVKTYRTDGISGFYSPKQTRGAAVLTDSVLQDVQARLDSGISVPDIATEFGLKKNTLSKAIGAGRLHNPLKKRRFNPRRQYAPGYIHQN